MQNQATPTGTGEAYELMSQLRELVTRYQDDASNVRELFSDGLVTLLQQLPGLSDEIISHVNSPDIGLHHVVSTLDHALAILGPNRTFSFLDKRLRLDSPEQVLAPKQKKNSAAKSV